MNIFKKICIVALMTIATLTGHSQILSGTGGGTLTLGSLQAGAYIILTTNTLTNTITIAATGGGGGGGVAQVYNTDGTITITNTTSNPLVSLNLGANNTWTGSNSMNFTQTGFSLESASASNSLTIVDLDTLTTARTLSISTNQNNVTLTIAGNSTINGSFLGGNSLTLNGGNVTLTSSGALNFATFTATLAGNSILAGISLNQTYTGNDTFSGTLTLSGTINTALTANQYLITTATGSLTTTSVGGGTVTQVTGGNFQGFNLFVTTSTSTPVVSLTTSSTVTFGTSAGNTETLSLLADSGSNASGAFWNIIPGNGTGTASSVGENLWVSIPGTTGSTVNTLTYGLQITQNTLTIGNTSVLLSATSLPGATSTNSVGNTLTISSGAGTGNAVSSPIYLQVSVPVSTGSNSQTFTNSLILTNLMATFSDNVNIPGTLTVTGVMSALNITGTFSGAGNTLTNSATGTLAIQGGTLTITNSPTISGSNTLSLSGASTLNGSLLGGGTFTSANTLTLAGGSVTITGSGAINLATFTLTLGGSLTTSGVFTVTSSGGALNLGANTLTVASGNVTLTGSGALNLASFTGTLAGNSVLAGLSLNQTFGGNDTFSGTLNVSSLTDSGGLSATTLSVSSFTNSGATTLTGSVTLSSTLSALGLNGTTTNSAGNSLTLSAGNGTGTGALSIVDILVPVLGTTGSTAQSITNGLEISSVTITIGQGETLSMFGLPTNTSTNSTGNTLTIASGVGTGNAASAAIYLQTSVPGASSSTSQTLTNSLILTNAIATFSNNLSVPGTLTVGGAFSALNVTGTFSGSGFTLTNSSTGTLAIEGGTFTVTGSPTLTGSNTLSISGNSTINGSLTGGGTFTSSNTLTVSTGNITLTGSGGLNFATFTLTLGASATLDLGGTFTTSGALTVTSAGGALNLGANTLTIATGNVTLTGSGALNFATFTGTLAGNSILAGIGLNQTFSGTNTFGAVTISASATALTLNGGLGPLAVTGSNQGGSNETISSGLGTGTGASSLLYFQVPVLQASGSTQQTYTYSEIQSNGTITFGSQSITLSSTGITGSTSTNTAGNTITISAGNGSGNGTPSLIIFDTSVLGSTGSLAQTMTQSLTLSANTATFGNSVFVNGTATLGATYVSSETNSGTLTVAGTVTFGGTINTNLTANQYVITTATGSFTTTVGGGGGGSGTVLSVTGSNNQGINITFSNPTTTPLLVLTTSSTVTLGNAAGTETLSLLNLTGGTSTDSAGGPWNIIPSGGSGAGASRGINLWANVPGASSSNSQTQTYTAQFIYDTVTFGSDAGGTTTTLSLYNLPTQNSFTNSAGSNLVIGPGSGTGNATAPYIEFLGFTATTSGTYAQTQGAVLTLSSGTSTFATALNMGANNITTTGSVSAGSLSLSNQALIWWGVANLNENNNFGYAFLSGTSQPFLPIRLQAGSSNAPSVDIVATTTGSVIFGGNSTSTSVLSTTFTNSATTTTSTTSVYGLINIGNGSGSTTFSATNSGQTYSIAANLVLGAAPLAGTNVTIDETDSLYAYGNIDMGGATATLTLGSPAGTGTVTISGANIPTNTLTNTTGNNVIISPGGSTGNAAVPYIAFEGFTAAGTGSTAATQAIIATFSSGTITFNTALNLGSNNLTTSGTITGSTLEGGTINSTNNLSVVNRFFLGGATSGPGMFAYNNASNNQAVLNIWSQSASTGIILAFVPSSSEQTTGTTNASAIAYNVTNSLGIVSGITTTSTQLYSFNNPNTAASGTITNFGIFNIVGATAPTLSATNTTVSYTNAYNLYVGVAPLAGTNVAITNGYSIGSAGLDNFAGGLYTTTISANPLPTTTTTNSAGNTLTISSGNGTGTGSPGLITFMTPILGTTGSTAQVMTISQQYAVNTETLGEQVAGDTYTISMYGPATQMVTNAAAGNLIISPGPGSGNASAPYVAILGYTATTSGSYSQPTVTIATLSSGTSTFGTNLNIGANSLTSTGTITTSTLSVTSAAINLINGGVDGTFLGSSNGSTLEVQGRGSAVAGSAINMGSAASNNQVQTSYSATLYWNYNNSFEIMGGLTNPQPGGSSVYSTAFRDGQTATASGVTNRAIFAIGLTGTDTISSLNTTTATNLQGIYIGTITTASGLTATNIYGIQSLMPVLWDEGEQAGGTSETLSAWGASGVTYNGLAATFTDSSTAGSGNTSLETFYSFAQPTLAAKNASVTTTTAATIYVANAPAAGTNQTITNTYSIYVAAGLVNWAGGEQTTTFSATGAATLSSATIVMANLPSAAGVSYVEQSATGSLEVQTIVSDPRLKNINSNVSPLGLIALNKAVANGAAISYKLKKDLPMNIANDDSEHLGFNAQVLHDIDPRLTDDTGGKDHYLALGVDSDHAIMSWEMQSISDLSVKVDNNITDLTKKIDEQAKLIDNLEEIIEKQKTLTK